MWDVELPQLYADTDPANYAPDPVDDAAVLRVAAGQQGRSRAPWCPDALICICRSAKD